MADPHPEAPQRRRRAALLLVTLATASACARRAPNVEPEADPSRLLAGIIATCAGAVHDVQIRRAGQASWEPAAAGAVLRVGDEVKTGPLSTARVAFLSGGALEIDELAAVVVDEEPAEAGAPRAGARPLAGGGAGVSRVAVTEGVVRGVLPRADGSGRPGAVVVVAADGTEIRVAPRSPGEPTAFRVSKQEAGTELAAIRGALALKDSRGDTGLRAGQLALAASGEVGAAVELLPAPRSVEPTVDARYESVPALAVRLRWGEVRGATGYRVQVARDLAFRDVELAQSVEGTDLVFVPRAAGVHAWRVAARDAAGRYGEFGVPRRFHCEEQAPRDLLAAPAEGAAVQASERASSHVTFSWDAPEEARSFRLVIARSPDLVADEVSSVPVSGRRAVVEIARPGEYWWGVYAGTDGDGRPLFTRPRRFALVRATPEARAQRPALEVPKAISQWGG